MTLSEMPQFAEALLNQHTVGRVIGYSRLRRLVAAKWLRPVERNGQAILFNPRDVHAALTRLERSACPPDKIEIRRVRASELRHGRSYIRHPRKPAPGLDEFELDLSALDL